MTSESVVGRLAAGELRSLCDLACQLLEKERDAVGPADQGGDGSLVELRRTGELLQHDAGLVVS